MIRDQIKAAQIAAMKSGEKDRVAATRLIIAAVKNKEIDSGVGAGNADDPLIADVLTKMAKQRRESIDMYDEAGRTELADKERFELAVIEEFMPAQMSEDEARAEIRKAIAETGAEGPKDMGKVMALLKERHAGSMDMKSASGLVKQELSA
ncbi:aspartyl-tRNA amidotransferase [Pacificimonas flava]|uniref:Aspartyl-tRNA amidotransferase n=2 Tax=Pacificimonas TaxID=1960290 RepID=A0A219B6U1_9SPHN|nr:MULTISPECIES: GatB/YqeY domain-containing protein [Pacificimonas]MBZ6378885.1 GatB/YqeY domain-containing protein [Pacificimonas aurantium]OWV33863.1 aspartyl-tRNA amidotransferase [Pacificimonas flava]